MRFMQKFEEELRTRISDIEPGREPDDLVLWIKKQVYESYRNGPVARDNREPNARPGKKSEPRPNR